MITSTTDPRPADFADVRATNLAVVLRFVREHAPCSRADIAASTGLNKATVSSLVADLIDRRLVRETGLTENRVGRPATMLVLDGSPYAAIGIEVNVDYVTAVAVDLSGRRLLSWRRSFPGATSAPGQAVAAVAGIVRRVVNRMAKEERQVLGVTVGVPGLVGLDGTVRIAPNLGWRDADLCGDLTKALRDPGFPVQVDNDANLAALAEHRFGPQAGTADLVYLTGEIGVGAGVILDGRLRRGGQGFGGEIGHLQLDPLGAECRCGRLGCLEAVAGIGAVLEQAALSPADVEAELEEVVRLARDGDPRTLTILKNVGHSLGKGVALAANLLNPEVVILGGYYVPLAPWLLPAVEAEMRGRMIAPDAGGCRVVASTLGYDAAALGGAARVLDSVDSGRLPRIS
ncbi:putative NBD/HSP70 family sugar kinase [Streptosporangium becharense]|uniref:Putative NBD/HSP70 family sugar kinase n=1 Tax=Streptosporangium becharense TaxID=1816182 RepID=A0A7W9IEZ2_9ACTN|nr:ROK family transcriptional regulator [Streptosporangium becharense]MBB2909621.1 putative NBD/HSP70 family sugar kinase [Streptosporangium becharense]MBB5819423.1 putative NBD/HSP70 family sugar kinase [Streptosporangium becharense]